MSIFHKPNATGLTPWLCATTVPLFAFSCVSLSAQQPPWEGCRAASKIEYESAKRDFLLQTSVGAYAMTGHWWHRYYLLLVLPLIVNRHRDAPHALWRSQGKPQQASIYSHPCVAGSPKRSTRAI
jgi:hypothetical protein